MDPSNEKKMSPAALYLMGGSRCEATVMIVITQVLSNKKMRKMVSFTVKVCFIAKCIVTSAPIKKWYTYEYHQNRR